VIAGPHDEGSRCVLGDFEEGFPGLDVDLPPFRAKGDLEPGGGVQVQPAAVDQHHLAVLANRSGIRIASRPDVDARHPKRHDQRNGPWPGVTAPALAGHIRVGRRQPGRLLPDLGATLEVLGALVRALPATRGTPVPSRRIASDRAAGRPKRRPRPRQCGSQEREVGQRSCAGGQCSKHAYQPSIQLVSSSAALAMCRSTVLTARSCSRAISL
jgi:hypothetical protein